MIKEFLSIKIIIIDNSKEAGMPKGEKTLNLK
jgi:hypothetical protein